MVEASLLSSQVLPLYELGDVLSIEPAPGSLAESSHIVSTTQKRIFIKRCSPGTTAATLQARHELIRFLVENNFAAPSLVPTRSNTTWLELNNQFYEAHQFVEGESFSVGNRKQIAGLGRILGQYHALIKGYTPSLPTNTKKRVVGYLDLRSRITKPLGWLSKHRRIHSDERRLVQTIVREIKEQARRFRHETELVRLIVHGAVEPGNVLFAPSDKVAALVNWTHSEEFVRIFDVASALLKFVGCRADSSLPGQIGPLLSWPRVQSFASTYCETITLTGSEVKLLPWLMRALHLGEALTVNEKYDTNYRHEIKMVASMHEWLNQNSDSLSELFC
ncbi:MAG: phosphotransferase [Anaerolineae bacterium]|nr:phosphotransferase [Anaerolineae bacterium]